MVFVQDLRLPLKLDAEHQFLPLLLGLDALRRELGVGRDEADRRGNDVLRNGIGDDARLVAERELAGNISGQVDRHVYVVEIEDGQNPLSWAHHLAGAGKPVLHPSTSRRHEHQVDQNRLQPLDVRLGGLDRGFSLVTFGVACNIYRLLALEFGATLDYNLLRYVSVLDDHFATV